MPPALPERDDEAMATVEKWYRRAKATLPAPFQARLDGFEQRRSDFIATDGMYELFCCLEAVKIADVLTFRKRTVAWFHGLSPKRQQKLVPAISLEHTDMSFNVACDLAYLAMTQPDVVPIHHAALCPIYGCREAGCYAAWRGTHEEVN